MILSIFLCAYLPSLEKCLYFLYSCPLFRMGLILQSRLTSRSYSFCFHHYHFQLFVLCWDYRYIPMFMCMLGKTPPVSYTPRSNPQLYFYFSFSSLCLCSCVLRCLRRPGEDTEFSWVGITGSCWLSDVDAGNWTLVLYQNTEPFLQLPSLQLLSIVFKFSASHTWVSYKWFTNIFS